MPIIGLLLMAALFSASISSEEVEGSIYEDKKNPKCEWIIVKDQYINVSQITVILPDTVFGGTKIFIPYSRNFTWISKVEPKQVISAIKNGYCNLDKINKK